MKNGLNLPRIGLWILLFGLTWSQTKNLAGCPYCGAVSLTFAEEFQKSDVVALVRQCTAVEARGLEITEGLQAFKVLIPIKGGEHLGQTDRVVTVYLGNEPADKQFLLMGIEPANLTWGTPIPLSAEGVKYVLELPKLDGKPVAERMAFFWKYLTHADKILSEDAYAEFAKAPFEEVRQLKNVLNHDELLALIKDPEVTPSRRRLYFTLLAVCDKASDIPFLEELLQGDDRNARMALDALINAYLMLRGPEGLTLIEDLFLKNLDADYTDTYSAIVSLRVHGQEVKTIPNERLVKSLRTILSRPDLADLVIPDLARWGDWESTHRLVELFVVSDAKSSWIRVPVINFLQASPEPRAKVLLDFVADVDPEAFRRAGAFAPLGVAPGTAPAPAPSVEGSGGPDATGARDAQSSPATPGQAVPTAPAQSVPGKSTVKEPPAAEGAAMVPQSEVSGEGLAVVESPNEAGGSSSAKVLPAAEPGPALEGDSAPAVASTSQAGPAPSPSLSAPPFQLGWRIALGAAVAGLALSGLFMGLLR